MCLQRTPGGIPLVDRPTGDHSTNTFFTGPAKPSCSRSDTLFNVEPCVHHRKTITTTVVTFIVLLGEVCSSMTQPRSGFSGVSILLTGSIAFRFHGSIAGHSLVKPLWGWI